MWGSFAVQVQVRVRATLRFSPEDKEGNSRETKEDEN